MEDKQWKEAEQPWSGYQKPPVPPQRTLASPTGARELVFGGAILLSAMLLCNFVIYGGFNLGFAIGILLTDLCSFGYLICSGRKLTFYTGTLLVLHLITAAGFARSDDSFVKFVMFCFLFVSGNLGLTLLAGKQRHDPAGFGTLGDVFYTAIVRSFSMTGPFAGLRGALQKSGTAAKKGGAVLAGVAIAIPLLLVMVFLLMRADAAFEGLMDMLPQFNLTELFVTLILGTAAACLLYSRGVGLNHSADTNPKTKQRKGINALTVNTVLIAVCAVYLVYLFSQLAYFAGGFAGILPNGYTMAEYARRGFFEMAWLCAINLGIVSLGVALVEKKTGAPLLTKLLCLFICVITVFFVAAASGKMFLYIGSYGLTRLRVLTQVIMLFLCIATVLVALWLFVPKLPYMKCIIIAALVIGAVVFWADVDTVVAQYNVNAYLSGSLEPVDMSHLSSLGSAAVPYIAELAENATDVFVANQAKDVLEYWWIAQPEDFRGWNYIRHIAESFLIKE